MSTFLLEIGTEELPADFSKQVVSQLSDNVLSDLDQSRLTHGNIHCSSTPRRIFLLIENLADKADDFVEERKGPPESQAFKNGSPAEAAIGFAKRCGLSPDELDIRETTKGSFVFAKIVEKGKPAKQLLIDLIPQWIGNLQGRRFMRWSSGTRRFSRPVRWIISLLDDQLIPFTLADCEPQVISSKKSRGHRLFKSSVTIPSASEYITALKNVGVQVDRKERRETIINLVKEASILYKSSPYIPNDLLEELTDLVELPSLISGKIDKEYLKLPPEVLTTVMRSHQRYIPLYFSDQLDSDPLSFDSQNTLNPSFLCISNALPEAKALVILGNERVLRARLSDAQFFVKADLAISSLSRCELLKNVSFAEGLGSLFDRVKRIEWIINGLLKTINCKTINAVSAKRAAQLCKHDLVSQIVGEFPELEGVMGGKYLIKEGESREVALAVLEHYLPRSTVDSLPSSSTGSILALAERFELLLSIFSKGERPSGSSDPFALRRAGNGILQILWNRNWLIDFNDFFDESIIYWSNLFPLFEINHSRLLNDLRLFFRQRIISLLEEEEIDIDIIKAVTGDLENVEALLSNPTEIKLRALLLSEMRKNNTLSSLYLVVTRASRLAVKSNLPVNILGPIGFVDTTLFEKESEFQLLNVINSLESISTSKSSDRYLELAKGLNDASRVLSEFFDGEQSVMVMSDNLKIRTNRLNLLAIIRNHALILADFSQIAS